MVQPKVLGWFTQKEGELQRCEKNEGSLPEDFGHRLNYDAIKNINEGTPENLDRKYRDFPSDNPDMTEAFHSTDLLKEFLTKIGFKPTKTTIVWRAAACDTIFFGKDVCQKLSYKKDGNYILISSVDTSISVSRECDDPFAISGEVILQDNLFTNAECPVFGESNDYQVVLFEFDDFDMIVSKEVDAFDKDNAAVEIRGVSEGNKINFRKMLFKSVFLGGIKRSVVNVLKDKTLKEVHFCDRLDVMNDAKDELLRYSELVSGFAKWLIKLEERSTEYSGTLFSNAAGVVAIPDNRKVYAIFNRRYPDSLKEFNQGVYPKIIYKGKSFFFPKLNVTPIDLEKLKLNLIRTDYPVIFYVQEGSSLENYSELENLAKNSNYFLFAQKTDAENKLSLDVVSRAQFVHFLMAIKPDIVSIYEPYSNQITVCVAPDQFKISAPVLNAVVRYEEPWTHSIGKKNFIVFSGNLSYLQRILSLYRKRKDPNFSEMDLTVVTMNSPPYSEDNIKKVFSRNDDLKVLKTLSIHCLTANPSEYKPRLRKILGLKDSFVSRDSSASRSALDSKAEQNQKHYLYLVREDSNISPSIQDFDVLEVDKFLKNGFESFRKMPNEIRVNADVRLEVENFVLKVKLDGGAQVLVQQL